MCRWRVYKICVNDLHASKCLFFYVLLLFIYIFSSSVSGLLLTEVMTGNTWDTIQQVKDLELKRLARTLPDTLLWGRADSTTRKYLGTFKR